MQTLVQRPALESSLEELDSFLWELSMNQWRLLEGPDAETLQSIDRDRVSVEDEILLRFPDSDAARDIRYERGESSESF